MIPLVLSIQATAPEHFTLESAVAAALRSSSLIKIAQSTAKAEGRRADETEGAGKPTLSASANALHFDQATRINFNPSTPPVTAIGEHTEALSLTASQRLDLYGQIRSATTQVHLQALADDFATQTQVRQRTLQAQVAYVELLKAQAQRQVAEDALTAARAQREQTRKLYEGGVGQKVDFLRAESALAQAEQAREVASNGEASARATFCNVVDKPLDTAITLAPLPAPPAALPELTTRTRAAQAQRDDLLQAETLLRAAELGVELARAGDRPSVALSASVSYCPTTSFQYPRQRTAAVGVSLTIPIFDGGVTRARTDQAALRRDGATSQRNLLRGNIALEVRQAFLALQTAQTQQASTQAAVTHARAARDLAQVRYQEQVGLFLELLDAQAALTRAETAHVTAQYETYLAFVRFESAAATVKEPTR